MRGEVLKPEGLNGKGLILGEDGRQYTFTAAHVHKGAALAATTPVDFLPLGEEARDIYPLTGRRPELSSQSIDAAYVPAVASRPDGFLKYFLRGVTSDYFRFDGRARRAEYFRYNVVVFSALLMLYLTDIAFSVVFLGYDGEGNGSVWPTLSGLFYLFTFIPGMAVTSRRLHDQEISAWMLLLYLLSYIGGLILFILMFFDSRPSPNRHGASPKYGAAQTVDVFA